MLTRRLGMRVVWGLCFGGVAAGACGKSSETAPHGTPGVDRPPGTGGSAGKGSVGQGGAGEGGMGGAATAAEAGMGAGGSMNSPSAPTVKITAPAPVSNPNDKGVIVAEQIDVYCEVTKTKLSRVVDDASVSIAMLDADGKVVDMMPAARTDRDNEYTVRFVTNHLERLR